MFGPSELLDFPDTLGLMIPGMCLAGVSVAFVFIPLLAEIIRAV